MEYLSLIVTFLISGGLSSLVTIKIIAKSQKIDYEAKLINFWKENNSELIDQNGKLKSIQAELMKDICFRNPCKERLQ